MQTTEIEISKRRLPHWRVPGGVYAITTRLEDSLPYDVVRQLADSKLEPAVRRERLERYLDAGYGSCVLRDPRCAQVVVDVLQHFDGVQYRLGPWSVMPNHFHATVKPMPGFMLNKILGAWRSVSAHRINKLSGRSGRLWEVEPYDSWLRDENDLARMRAYILNNPAAAGLKDWPWVGDPDTTGMLEKWPV